MEKSPFYDQIIAVYSDTYKEVKGTYPLVSALFLGPLKETTVLKSRFCFMPSVSAKSLYNFILRSSQPTNQMACNCFCNCQ